MKQNSAEHASDQSAAVVVPLAHVRAADGWLAGGKGANLGELIGAGFPVPAGFVVTTVAYDRFVAKSNLHGTIGQALREAHGSGAAIRTAFADVPVPPDIERHVRAAYATLGHAPVAVRSSATAEDLPQAAFAGQQDTFLNVEGPEALLDALRHCWASLWTDRAIAYRKHQQIDQQTVKLAVVVQRMVTPRVAGVLFTANPVTGARDEIVVDASPGLGEAIVSGLVTPDHFVLARRSGRVKERHRGRREVIVRARPGGGTEHVAGSPASNDPVVPDRVLRRLARLAVAIEKHFGRPQDIEWAWTECGLVILQARPITALPEPTPRPSRRQQLMTSMAAELLPARPYPLDVTAWAPAFFGAVAPLFELLGFEVVFHQLFVEEDGVVVRLSGKLPIRPTPRILLAPVKLLRLSARYNPLHWRADAARLHALTRVHALEARDLRPLAWDELLGMMHEAQALPRSLAGEPRRRYLPRAALAAAVLRLALGLLRQGKHFVVLLSGVETLTLETNRALETLAGTVRSDPQLTGAFAHHAADELGAVLEVSSGGRAFLAELQAFLDDYGHREAVALLLSQPTWKDAPAVVLGILQGLTATPPPPPATQPAWAVARDTLLAHRLLRLRTVRSALLRLLGTARCLLQIREDTHFDATRPLPLLRRTALELGRRLMDIGVLDAPEDVFHLKLDELASIDGTWPPAPQHAEELRALVLRRAAQRAALANTPLIDREPSRSAERAGNVLLRGMPGSPGLAEGPVRIIHTGTEFGRLRAGEVLVAPFTNPAWTPLFQRAAAVVVDSGGAGSHAAIVAREYGIPAIMGTLDGSRRLVDGQRVRVDGTRGLVLVTATVTH